jgi:hypothetical protein
MNMVVDVRDILNRLVVLCGSAQMEAISARLDEIAAATDHREARGITYTLLGDLRRDASHFDERAEVVTSFIALVREIDTGCVPLVTAPEPAPEPAPTAVAEAEAAELDAAMHRLAEVIRD